MSIQEKVASYEKNRKWALMQALLKTDFHLYVEY